MEDRSQELNRSQELTRALRTKELDSFINRCLKAQEFINKASKVAPMAKYQSSHDQLSIAHRALKDAIAIAQGTRSW